MYQITTKSGDLIATAITEELAIKIVDAIRTEKSKTIPTIKIYDLTGDLLRTYTGKTHIEDMELCVRSYNCLFRAGILFSDDIMALSMNEILAVRHMTKKCALEIIEKCMEVD